MSGRRPSGLLRFARTTLNGTLGWHACAAPRLAEVRELNIDTDEHCLRARLYVPADSENRPAIVYFHGGGFVFSGLTTHDALCRWLAEAAGLRVVAVSYRLAPECPFPGQVDDAVAGCRWVVATSAALGVDAARIVVAGDSAGAYLAARVAAQLADEAPGLVAAQLLLSPLVQIDDKVWAAETFANFRWVGRAAVAYIRHALGAQAFAPLVPSGREPPTIVVHGGMLDPIGADARAYASGLGVLNGDVRTLYYPRLIHGGLNLTRTSPLARRALREAGGLLRETVAATKHR